MALRLPLDGGPPMRVHCLLIDLAMRRIGEKNSRAALHSAAPCLYLSLLWLRIAPQGLRTWRGFSCIAAV